MVKIGVSACLLGHAVRYDGSHKKNHYITEVLAPQVTLTSICPETAIGLPTPREPIHLIQENNQTKVKKVNGHSQDYSQKLLQLSSKNQRQIATWHGLITMQKSPSCGLNSTKLHTPSGTVLKYQESGVFIQACRQQFPDLPMIEAIELEQQTTRHQFLTQVFTLYRWQQQVLKQATIKNLQKFHRRHKFLLQAHSEKHYRQMGVLAAVPQPDQNVSTSGAKRPADPVGWRRAGNEQMTVLPEAKKSSVNAVARQSEGRAFDSMPSCAAGFHTQYERREARHLLYQQLLVQCLRQKPSRNQHLNAILHLFGFLKSHLTAKEKQQILQTIDQYQQQLLPLTEPLKQIKQVADKHQIHYLQQQTYFQPYPKKLK